MYDRPLVILSLPRVFTFTRVVISMKRAQSLETLNARLPVELKRAETVIGINSKTVARPAQELIHKTFAASFIFRAASFIRSTITTYIGVSS